MREFREENTSDERDVRRLLLRTSAIVRLQQEARIVACWKRGQVLKEDVVGKDAGWKGGDLVGVEIAARRVWTRR